VCKWHAGELTLKDLKQAGNGNSLARTRRVLPAGAVTNCTPLELAMPVSSDDELGICRGPINTADCAMYASLQQPEWSSPP
jgi:hypothetical protein